MATAGDDGVLRVWDTQRRELIAMREEESYTAARCVAWSPDGALIGVGFGPTDQTAKQGAFDIVNATTLEVLFQVSEAVI